MVEQEHSEQQQKTMWT